MQTSECSAVVRQTTNPEHYAGAVWPFRQPTRRHRCSSTAASCKLHHFQQYRLKRRMCTRLLSGCPSRISAWKTHQNLPRGGALLDGGYGQRSPARGRRHRLTRALLANWPCPPRSHRRPHVLLARSSTRLAIKTRAKPWQEGLLRRFRLLIGVLTPTFGTQPFLGSKALPSCQTPQSEAPLQARSTSARAPSPSHRVYALSIWLVEPIPRGQCTHKHEKQKGET